MMRSAPGSSALLWLAATAATLAAQDASEPRTAVLPEAITVGDVFHAAIRIETAPGLRVVFPDTLATPPDVEAAGRVAVRVDTTATGLTHTAVYALAAWRPDTVALPSTPVRVLARGGSRELTAEFPIFEIRSVLPADTAGIQPKGAKDVLGASRLWWPWLVALAVLLAIAAAVLWWLRRRRPEPVVPAVPALSPRELALQSLDRARKLDLARDGDVMKEFYSRVSDALREYAAAVEPDWGGDLTTTELRARVRGRGDTLVAEMLTVLGEADLVKFARSRPGVDDALARWGQARRFVELYEPPSATLSQEARAA